MTGLWRPALVAVATAITCGLFVGETTVGAMQVRRGAVVPDETTQAGLIEAGLRWARTHHTTADQCPQPSLPYQYGCVLGTSS